jgi:hypothetical protein
MTPLEKQIDTLFAKLDRAENTAKECYLKIVELVKKHSVSKSEVYDSIRRSRPTLSDGAAKGMASKIIRLARDSKLLKQVKAGTVQFWNLPNVKPRKELTEFPDPRGTTAIIEWAARKAAICFTYKEFMKICADAYTDASYRNEEKAA